MTQRKPYVGIAGFTSSNEIMAAFETMPALSANLSHSLAVGILTSAKTIGGQTNRYPNRYPKVDEIENIVRPARDVRDANVLPVEFVLHYAIGSMNRIAEELAIVGKIVETCKFDGLQINMAPHFVADRDLTRALGGMKVDNEDLRIVMQIRTARENEPFVDLVGAAMWAMEGEATDLLFDASAGHGVDLNPIWASGMIHAVRSSLSTRGRYKVGLGIAGGLRRGKLASVYGLLSTHGPLSFDAESGVRDEDDRMHVPTMKAYLDEAWNLVRNGKRVGG